MDSNRTEYSDAALALTFIIGGFIGATLGLLFAPRTGTELRGKIKERAKGAREKALESTETVRERAEKLAEAGKERLAEGREKAKELVGNIRERVLPKEQDKPRKIRL